MNYAEESLKRHREWRGKIEVVPTVLVKSREDLSLAYTPGVAQPCLEIQKNINFKLQSDPALEYVRSDH